MDIFVIWTFLGHSNPFANAQFKNWLSKKLYHYVKREQENKNVLWMMERAGKDALRCNTFLKGLRQPCWCTTHLGHKCSGMVIYTAYKKYRQTQTDALKIMVYNPRYDLNLFCHLGSGAPWGSTKLHLSFISPCLIHSFCLRFSFLPLPLPFQPSPVL